MTDEATQLEQQVHAVKRYLKATRLCMDELLTIQQLFTIRTSEGADRRILAKLKEGRQLWEHGYKEARQKLVWGVDDLELKLQNCLDRFEVDEVLEVAAKEMLSKAKSLLKEKFDPALL